MPRMFESIGAGPVRSGRHESLTLCKIAIRRKMTANASGLAATGMLRYVTFALQFPRVQFSGDYRPILN